MTSKVFFDTSVLVYAFASRPRVPLDSRVDRAEELLSIGGFVSVQVVNEFADVASHKLRLDWDSVDRGLSAIRALCGRALPLEAETHSLAVDLSKTYGFRIYDSLILASAAQAGCDTVYTEDMQHGQMIGKVKIVNPFL